jgi:hypothetical protein
MPIRNPRWLPPQVIVLTQDHMEKYRNNFFSKAIALIELKLCINHCKVLYKIRVFYVDRNSKMTTTAGHSFYISHLGFRIGIKKKLFRGPSNDYFWAVWFQLS